jgi:hypothetical protein
MDCLDVGQDIEGPQVRDGMRMRGQDDADGVSAIGHR